MNNFEILLLNILILCITACNGLNKMKVVAEWNAVEYKFPSDILKQQANVQQLSGITIDVDVHYNEQGSTKVFVTVPRFAAGVPITLGLLTKDYGELGPQIEAYPSYVWQNPNNVYNCDGFTSVFRIAIDQCNRLWVLDSGRVGDVQHCPPQLVVFNLLNDKVIHRYRIPRSQYIDNISLFITPVVDVLDPFPNKCRRTMVYMADVSSFAMVVYDFKQNLSWRIQNKLMYPYPNYGTFTIAGESFDLMDGILGMAITPNNNNIFYGDRQMYFHALASSAEMHVPLSLLNNQSNWLNNPNALPRSFEVLGDREYQSAAQVMDPNGNMFFGLVSANALACWDSKQTYRKRNIHIIEQDENNLQFVSGIKIVKNQQGELELWACTSKLQKYMTGTISNSEVNFRILAVKLNDLLDGTQCTSKESSSSQITFQD